jgi:integrase
LARLWCAKPPLPSKRHAPHTKPPLHFVARQLGHAIPETTLQVYAHLLDKTANIWRVRDFVNGRFASLTTSGG